MPDESEKNTYDRVIRNNITCNDEDSELFHINGTNGIFKCLCATSNRCLCIPVCHCVNCKSCHKPVNSMSLDMLYILGFYIVVSLIICYF